MEFLLSEPDVSSIFFFDFLSGSLILSHFVKNSFFYKSKHIVMSIDLSLAAHVCLTII